MRKKKFEDVLTPICQLATYAFIIAAVLFLVYTGSQLFRNVTVQKEQNEHLRNTVSYLQNQFSAYDATGRFSVDKGPEKTGDMLVFKLPEEDFRLYIYTYKGYLVEELGNASGARPKRAERITPIKSFQVRERKGQRLLIDMDGVSAWITLRSREGAGANG